MTTKQNDAIETIRSNYTFEQQREIFVEECAEAIKAAQKLKRVSYTENSVSEVYENFCEEIADVLIMAEQMKRFVGESKINMLIDAKLERQLDRISWEAQE